MSLEPLFDFASETQRTGETRNEPLRCVGLFAGIGGIELGLHASGHRTQLLCELDSAADVVLRSRFPEADVVADVRDLDSLPQSTNLLAGGFPCQDLSQAGQTKGIAGEKSGLVGEVFRLLDRNDPTWLLLENVPFMLQLDRGQAMHVLVDWLSESGFRWAYRVVDTRSFGLPQRRRRVLLLASRTEDPRNVLLTDDAGNPGDPSHPTAFGFYWTEGERGVGWGVDVVPTLKGGSGLGIPSPPAVWFPEGKGRVIKPDIRDAERLQGFPEDWTKPAEELGRTRATSASRRLIARIPPWFPTGRNRGSASPAQLRGFPPRRTSPGVRSVVARESKSMSRNMLARIALLVALDLPRFPGHAPPSVG